MTEAAEESVAALAAGTRGTLSIGITPPVGPSLMPHILGEVARQAPGLALKTSRYWLPDLGAALAVGEVDIAITCDRIEDEARRFETVELGSEPLLVGLRDGPSPRRGRRGRPRLRSPRSPSASTLADSSPPGTRPSSPPSPRPRSIRRRSSSPTPTSPPRAGPTSRRSTGSSCSAPSADPTRGRHVLPVAPARYIPFTMSWLDYRSDLPSIRRFAEIVQRDGRPQGWRPPPVGQWESADLARPESTA